MLLHFKREAELEPVESPPLATDNLLENADGGTPSVFSRGGTLLPSVYADARYVDAVIVSKAGRDVDRGVIQIPGEAHLPADAKHMESVHH